MGFVIKEFYLADYAFGGKEIPEAELQPLLDKACDQVDTLCYGRITANGFSNLSTFQQEKLKRAVCYQAEFNYIYGEYLNMPVTGYSAGSISVTLGGNILTGTGGVRTSQEVTSMLVSTGLMNRGLY